MEKELILVDTSIFIDYFRKSDKRNSDFYRLISTNQFVFAVSVITEYEIYIGATDEQQDFWNKLFARMRILDFDTKSAKEAVRIQKKLKANNRMIDIPDLLIGATAMSQGLRITTKNVSHFNRIAGLEIVSGD